MTRPLVTAIAGDPGGAKALLPVLQRLRDEGRVELRLWAYRQAEAVWKAAGLSAEPVGEWTDDQAKQRLAAHPTALLLLGTSLNEVQFEARCTRVARGLGIPTLALLDFWTNLRERFCPRPGDPPEFPDALAVMDPWTRDALASAGLSTDRIMVTGQPAFDGVRARTKRLRSLVPDIRGELGLNPGERLVLFLSQPIADVYGSQPSSPRYLGYTETSVLAALAQALTGCAGLGRVRVVVRPHPREDIDCLRERAEHHGFTVATPTPWQTDELAVAADVVIGMNTAFLVESCLLGCITLSLQPRLQSTDVLTVATHGAVEVIRDPEQIPARVREYLFDDGIRQAVRQRLRAMPAWDGSTAAVASAVYQWAQCQN